MAKKSHSLGSKNFFTLVVLSVSALGLMVLTYATQQKTNTQSDARMANENPNESIVSNTTNYYCNKFSWDYRGSTGAAKSVTYSLALKNNCDEKQRFELWASVRESGSKRDLIIRDGWTFEFGDNGINTDLVKSVDPHDSSGTRVMISRAKANARDGAYKVTFYAAPCKDRACERLNFDKTVTYTTTYNVEN